MDRQSSIPFARVVMWSHVHANYRWLGQIEVKNSSFAFPLKPASRASLDPTNVHSTVTIIFPLISIFFFNHPRIFSSTRSSSTITLQKEAFMTTKQCTRYSIHKLSIDQKLCVVYLNWWHDRFFNRNWSAEPMMRGTCSIWISSIAKCY